MWGFGRVNKQANQPVKKQEENVTTCSLELIGDLIGHSSSVEVTLPVLAALAAPTLESRFFLTQSL